jgi:hypothetical protein
MPLVPAGLSAAIKSEIQGQYGAPDDAATLQKFCDALAQAICSYITANAVVSVNTAGVMPGPSSLPGVGTIS